MIMKIKIKDKEINIHEGAIFEVIDGDLVVTPNESGFKYGDILVIEDGSCPFIFKRMVDSILQYVVGLAADGTLMFSTGKTWTYEKVRIATYKEYMPLIEALEKQGKSWNPETKQMEDILKVGDICIFYDNKCKDRATIGVLSKIDNSDLSYMDNYCLWHRNAIKFESIEQYKNFIKQ